MHKRVCARGLNPHPAWLLFAGDIKQNGAPTDRYIIAEVGGNDNCNSWEVSIHRSYTMHALRQQLLCKKRAVLFKYSKTMFIPISLRVPGYNTFIYLLTSL